MQYINKLNYSAIKNKILSSPRKLMESEVITFGELSQSYKSRYPILSLTSEISEKKKRTEGTIASVGGEREVRSARVLEVGSR